MKTDAREILQNIATIDSKPDKTDAEDSESAPTPQQIHFHKMTQAPVPRLVLTLAVPTIVSMLITAIYNMADTYFVSQLGTSATGAVGVVASLMLVIQAVGSTLGTGAGSSVGRMLGAKQNAEATETASTAFFSALVLGGVLCLAGSIFLSPLVRILGATQTIAPYAEDYARWILLSAPIMCASFVMNNILRGEGRTVLSMIGIAAGGVLNIALDPIFIYTLKLGITGAAIATALSFFFAPDIIAQFQSDDATVITIGTFAFRAQCLVLPVFGITTATIMALQCTEHTRGAIFLSLCRQGICFMPLILVLPSSIGLLGVQLAQPISDILSLLFCLPFLLYFLRELRRKGTQHRSQNFEKS